ncbi:unnamed protein product [Paramecium octaurelia]|uniref:Uncharacterized protein n=1 Tax=Paramecium octaurelia TaxID=43137 RepID=A0A8S1W404_PAROT|nr:unnamed protein product [Paramecium octaurelia]
MHYLQLLWILHMCLLIRSCNQQCSLLRDHNYVEHYGLSRKEIQPGKYEKQTFDTVGMLHTDYSIISYLYSKDIQTITKILTNPTERSVHIKKAPNCNMDMQCVFYQHGYQNNGLKLWICYQRNGNIM